MIAEQSIRPVGKLIESGPSSEATTATVAA
jgi:hypothetical protein